jgi:two-component system, cell cycle sensor histidine kinase and response regulator CckA
MFDKTTAHNSPVVLTILIAAGVLGNYFSLPLFFGADFLFGSVAVLLVLYFYGLGWGMLAAVIAHGYTYFLWGHPYGFINFTSEALFIGILLRITRRNLMWLGGVFWLLLGMPFAGIEHGMIMHMDIITVLFTMFKQAVNGVFNALLASLAIHYLPWGRFLQRGQILQKVTLRDSLFNLLVSMVLFPALLLTMLQIRQDKQALESQIMADLQLLSVHAQSHVRSWYQTHLEAVKELAYLAEKASMTPSSRLQSEVRILNRAFSDFRTMHVENADGRTIAFDPPVNEKGKSNLGLDFSDRRWFQEAKAGQRPHVSEVFMGQLAVLSPIINVSVPVVKSHRWIGCSTGTLDLTRVQEILKSYGSNKLTILTLTDSNGRIIASTAPDRKPTALLDKAAGLASNPLAASMYIRQPEDRRLPSMTRWQQSFYVAETSLGPELPWRLLAETPVAPLQRALYTNYMKNLALMAFLIAAALFLAHIFSLGLTRPLARLAQMTADWRDRLMRPETTDWPASSTHEVESLIGNFKAMGGALAASFSELQKNGDELGRMNEELRQEIQERERTEEALRKSEQEAQRLSQENEIIAEIGRTVSSTLNIDDVYEKFTGEVSKLIPLDGIGIALIDPEADLATITYVSGIASPVRQKGSTFPLPGTVVEMAAQKGSGTIVLMEDREELEALGPNLLRAFDAGIRSRMVVPLSSRDQIIGSLDIRSAKPEAYTERDLRLAESIASQIAGAIAGARLYGELKQAEIALRESEVKYRAVVDTSLVGFCIIQDGLFKFVNKRFCDIYGYSYEEFVNGMDFLFPIHPDDKKMVEESVAKRLSGELERVEHEFRAIRKDGDVITVKVLGSSIVYDGRPATTGSVIDVTREKALESQFFQAQKMEAIGVLAGGIAHDFNNILMTILGYTSLMLMDTDPENQNYEQLQIIERQVQSAAELTKQLLGFARGGKYEIKTTDLNGLLTRSVDMFGRTKKEISVHCAYDESLWNVDIDRGQMEQVFLNLFVNAWQAMPGGGEIYVETRNVVLDDPILQVGSIKKGKYVKVSVTDTGEGMDDATRQRIFEPFFTTKTMGRGAGLGLATVYGIVKNHGGAINVYSEKGQGSTFNLYLPASDKPFEEEHRETAQVLKGSGTILLVDDQDAVLNVGRVILDKLGYKVFTARSGDEAVKVYQERNGGVDLVILDMIMPGMSGGETFAALKKLNNHIKVILSSGYSVNDQVLKVMEQGCNGFIQKPFNVPDLSRKIRESLA